MDLGLAGRKAIILGASRGIGRYTAEALLDEGASIAICGRDPERLEAAREELAARADGTVHAATADLANPDSTRAFVAGAVEALGGLDILIHNATGQSGQDAEGWQGTFDVDVMAGVHAVEAAQPALEAERCRQHHLHRLDRQQAVVRTLVLVRTPEGRHARARQRARPGASGARASA